MGEINYSTLLRSLVDQYFDNQMSRVEYLAQRRNLLESIDRDFNGEFSDCECDVSSAPQGRDEPATYPLFQSIIEPPRP